MRNELLPQALVLLGAIVTVVPLFTRLGLGSVPGYLVAGLLVGPPLFGWVTEHELIASVAEFGVVFLLFSIGIELRPARLWVMRRLVFGLGGCQLLVCGAAIAAAMYWQGFAPGQALLCGLALALSSTAIVLQLLAERGELPGQRGRAVFAVLLLQDVAVAPLIMLAYFIGNRGAPASAHPLALLLEALATLGLVMLLGRVAWRRVLPVMAEQRNADVLVALALLLVLGTAWLVEHAGMSLALGAFLAGVLLADSPFRHQLVADLQPFRGILLGLFFMSVGMSIERQTVIGSGSMLLALALALMALKAVSICALLRLFGLRAGDAVHGALQLSQTGEFALILFTLAAGQGVIDDAQRMALCQVVVVSMLLTPLADLLGRLAARALQPSAPSTAVLATVVDGDLRSHVVICGFGRVGRQIARLLDAAGQRWVATDLDSETVENARRGGMPVFYGDCGRTEILRALGGGNAALVLITLDERGATERALAAIRQLAPTVAIIARAADHAQAHALHAEGALRAVPETSEYSLQLGLAGLAALGLDADRRQELEDDFRDREYARLVGDTLART